MKDFLDRHNHRILGVINGFDRMRFRGSLREMAYAMGMFRYLWDIQVKLKHFKEHALSVSDKIKQATERIAESAGRQMVYLPTYKICKEDVALKIAKEEQITEGLICVIRCVESCHSFYVQGCYKTKQLHMKRGTRKCLHYYFYLMDRRFGFMHFRLQTWFPFTIWLCMNGREWLARAMDKAGIGYLRRDNCFVHIDDIPAAQRLSNNQLKTNWVNAFDRLARQFHPSHKSIFAKSPMDYYWSMDESEWASDVMFRSRSSLAEVYPKFIHHGMTTFSSPDVMRFLGKKLLPNGQVHHAFEGELVSDMRRRKEGVRIKHRIRRNWIKMYDKQGTVLRIETTINHPNDMKVYRPKEGEPNGKKDWRPMRKGVADVYRRAEISQAANGRYLNALAAVDDDQSLGKLTEKLCRPVKWKGKRERGLNPLSTEDNRLLKAISGGEFMINGFRNKDIRQILFGTRNTSNSETKKQSGKVTRRFRLLRAHGLIRKVSKTHRYMVTDKGRLAITALLAAQNANTKKLTEAA
jgi:hypothetical protein